MTKNIMHIIRDNYVNNRTVIRVAKDNQDKLLRVVDLLADTVGEYKVERVYNIEAAVKRAREIIY